MHYYPMFPVAPTYMYPPLNQHLHAELTAIRHGHLIREQAELQYLQRTNHQLASLDRAAHYSNEALEKELRIARLLEEDRAQLLLERQMLEERSLREEIRFKEQMRKLDLQRQYLLSRETRPYMTERKREIQNESFRQTLKNPVSEANKETAKFNSVQYGGQVLNFKPKDYYVPHPKQEQMKQEIPQGQTNLQSSNKRRKVQSVVKNITYNQSDQNNLISSNKRRSSILKNSQAKSPKLAKSKKQVQFLKQSNKKSNSSNSASPGPSKQDSYCLNNSALRAAYNSNRKRPQSSASKMIQNRLKVSTVVYRDSQFRNIKHEVDHLANTYDTECRLRRDLKSKINGKDEVIKKYNIVPPGTK